MPISSQKMRDLTANAPIRETANAVMSVVTALSDRSAPGIRLLGIAVAFRQLQQASGLSTSDLLTYAHNATHEYGALRPEFAAARDYIEQEILA